MGWRDAYKVHPAADVFPMMSDEDLADLGENIKKHGLLEPIKLLRVGKEQQIAENVSQQPEVLIDGRNRLEAMERVGIDADSCVARAEYVNGRRGPFDFDVAVYVIAANIHRRHLTPMERAELIVKAIKAGNKLDQAEPVSKGGRGKKNPIREKAVAAGAEHGISESTIKRAIAKAEGRTPKPPVEVSPEYEKDKAECIALYHKAEAARAALAKAEGKVTTRKPLQPYIRTARQEYLRCFAELDCASMQDEALKIGGRISALLGKAERAASTLPQDGRSEVPLDDSTRRAG